MLNPEIQHKHLIIRANVENALIDDAQAEDWLRRLVKNIDMEIFMGPYSEYWDQEGNRGRTALVGLTTSSMTCHIWDEVSPAIINLDVYSCKNFDPKIIFAMLDELGSSNVKYKFIDRQEGLIELDAGSF